jgi:hypothetical protein
MANIQKSRQGSHSFPLCMARYRLRKPLHNLAGQNTSIRAGRRGFGRVLVGGRDHAESTNPQYACLNLLFLVKLKFFGNDMDKASAIKQVCEDQPQQAPSLGSDFSNGPVPPICKTCAPVGADYQWNYTKDGSECVKETVKLSETEWGERTTASSPAECHVNNDTSENRTTLDIIFCTTKVGFYLHSFLISRPDKLALAPGDWCQIKHGTRPDRSLESNNSWSISGDWASSHRAQDCVSAHAHFVVRRISERRLVSNVLFLFAFSSRPLKYPSVTSNEH